MPEVREGVIPIREAEAATLNRLDKKRKVTALTRRDPGNTGPLLVEAGGRRYRVSENGKLVRLGWWRRV